MELRCQKVSCAVCGESFGSKADFSDPISKQDIERESKVYADEKEMEYVNALREIIEKIVGVSIAFENR